MRRPTVLPARVACLLASLSIAAVLTTSGAAAATGDDEATIALIGRTGPAVAIVLGNPMGDLPGSSSVGIVSGLDRDILVDGRGGAVSSLRHLIQTDAAVNAGDSGGAVLDGDGDLIGITTAEAEYADGIGFALPIDLAKPIIEQMRAGEPIARPYIGVVYREIDGQLASAESLPVDDGAWITSVDGSTSPVVDDGPADVAGVEDGDIITAVDGLPIDRANPLDLQVLRFGPGDRVALSILRDGEPLTLEATLGERPADLAG